MPHLESIDKEEAPYQTVAGGLGSDAASTNNSVGESLTAHTSIPTVQLPNLAAPDLNGFLNDHGIDNGNHGSDGPLNQIPGGPDDNDGPMSNLPSPTGGNTNTGIPDDLDLNHGGLGVPDEVDLGGNGPLTGTGVPNGIDVDKNDITGVGVPDDINNQGGITGPGVPGGSGHVGVGGFTPGDFDNGHLTDSPDYGTQWSPAWSSATHGDTANAAYQVAGQLIYNSDHYMANGETAMGLVDGIAGGVVLMSWGLGPLIENTIAKALSPDTTPQPAPEANSPPPTQASDTPPPPADPDPAPNPDPGKGNQPVDDSGTGAHPSTHGTEQPVDDSGLGPSHPTTATTAQPVDDSGAGPVHPTSPATTAQPVDDSGTGLGHPGTHLGALANDASNSANLVTASVGEAGKEAGHSFGGLSAAFWDAAAHSVADSQHASAATTNTPAADANAPVAHTDSLGIFEHSSAPSIAASASVADSHANMDVLATTHIDNTHADTESSHSLHVELNLGHLNLHM